MARRTRSSKLENRTSRLKLAAKTKPYTVLIAPNIHLGYRRNDGPGSWSVKAHGWLRRFALADDHETANGDTVMSYWEALEKAKELARIGEGNDVPITVKEALEDLETELEPRGGKAKYNATTIMRRHLSDALADKPVALLKKRDLDDWRKAMIRKDLDLASVSRYAKSLASALNLAASNHEGIKNAKAWKEGLRAVAVNDDGDDEAVRENFILQDQTVAAIVRGCHEDDQGDGFGALIHTLADTGARESQVLRLKVRHFEDDQDAPCLMMPTSRKGSNRKKLRKTEFRPLPISLRLAGLLRQLVRGRHADDLIFKKIEKLVLRFRPVIERLGLDPSITPYALRHSSIVRQLLKGTVIRLVAGNHDTSVAVIEAHYSRFIVSRQTDAMTRATLIDHDDASVQSNVIALAKR